MCQHSEIVAHRGIMREVEFLMFRPILGILATALLATLGVLPMPATAKTFPGSTTIRASVSVSYTQSTGCTHDVSLRGWQVCRLRVTRPISHSRDETVCTCTTRAPDVPNWCWWPAMEQSPTPCRGRLWSAATDASSPSCRGRPVWCPRRQRARRHLRAGPLDPPHGAGLDRQFLRVKSFHRTWCVHAAVISCLPGDRGSVLR